MIDIFMKLRKCVKEATGNDVIKDNGRQASNVNARFIFIKLTDEVGIDKGLVSVYLNRNRSSYYNAIKKHQNYLDTDATYRNLYLAAEKLFLEETKDVDLKKSAEAFNLFYEVSKYRKKITRLIQEMHNINEIKSLAEINF